MKVAAIILGIVLGFALLIGGICFASYVSASNYGNSSEQALSAQYQDNQNVLAQYTTKIAEIAQVPSMYKKDLQDVIDSTFKGRYGSDGSKAVVQFIKEQNLNLDPSMYKEIQTQMIAGRNKFENSQTRLIDLRRSYQTALGSFWQGMWLKFAGYPKTDLSKYDPVINAHTEEAFKTKRDEGVKL
jgi:hypothetical protein